MALSRLDEIKTRIQAFRAGEAKRGSPWEGGPGEDMDYLVSEIDRLCEALEEAQDQICAEFCGSQHHDFCKSANDALALTTQQGEQKDG